jgi:hypothetical protein
LGGTRNHRDNDDVISCKVTESLKPTCTIIQEAIPLKKRCIKCVCVIYKFLKVFQGNLGREGRTPQILKEAIKAVGPEANDYVVLLRYVA